MAQGCLKCIRTKWPRHHPLPAPKRTTTSKSHQLPPSCINTYTAEQTPMLLHLQWEPWAAAQVHSLRANTIPLQLDDRRTKSKLKKHSTTRHSKEVSPSQRAPAKMTTAQQILTAKGRGANVALLINTKENLTTLG